MKILNFGSLNIDQVYQVDHIVRPGETLPGTSYQVFAGGKGANQSAALARAGAPVYHAGQVGPEGGWLLEKLAGLGADMRFTRRSDTPTGRALIQVDRTGENAIILHPGANTRMERGHIDQVLSEFNKDDILLLQNEINEIPYLIEQAHKRGLQVYLNPAPFTPELHSYPLERLHTILLNQTEGQNLTRRNTPEDILAHLRENLPSTVVVLTLGAAGAHYDSPTERLHIPAPRVEVADTTAAGDTFIGYFLAGLAAKRPPAEALRRAARAAALCVALPGAMDSIPALEEVLAA